MLVVYEEEFYRIIEFMDYEIFCSLRRAEPDRLVRIARQGGAEIDVKISDLEDYSIWRNKRCFS